jgi:hypothetical protein
MKVKATATIYKFDPSHRRRITIGESISNAINNNVLSFSYRHAHIIFASLHSPIKPLPNLRSKKRFGRKPASQKEVKKKAAAPKPNTKLKPKAKATDDHKGLSVLIHVAVGNYSPIKYDHWVLVDNANVSESSLCALIRIAVCNDSPIKCDHRIFVANVNVARARPDYANGRVNHDIDEEMSHINFKGAACLD